MKTLNTSSRLALRVMAVILTGLLTTQLMVAQDWFNNSWSYRRTITVPNPGSTALTDFQVKVTLNSSTPFDFTKAKSNGSDIRVTSDDGTTLIPFWIEGWDDVLQQATVWVKVPTIPASGTTNILLYYGNAAATSVSNGMSTFRFFDDFESWNVTPPPTAWADKTPMPTPKADPTAAVYNGKLYLIGGYTAGANTPENLNREYDPATNAWTLKASMPTARWGMVAVEFDGLIYVFGGYDGANNIAKNEVYNPVSDIWTTRNDMPAILGQGVMGVRYGDKIHLFYMNYHYEYDPVTDEYTPKTPLLYPRM